MQSNSRELKQKSTLKHKLFEQKINRRLIGKSRAIIMFMP